MTEKQRREIEDNFLSIINDALQGISFGIKDGVNGCWVLDGGIGDWLKKAGETYDLIMRIRTSEDNQK